ncbi:hypothetical protein DPMN_055415 [Dreissena polymorpha]|uniref:Uncharacterized protein n=1 Tax=Dreissena polymorpha TaxID=45954 RepID=A0A9D4HS98_DREPO|nr:hypothetical protein DPMN_055415 [Dreissena polymorpha]
MMKHFQCQVLLTTDRQITCRKTKQISDSNTHDMDLPSTSTGYEYDELDCKDSSNIMTDLKDKVETSENLQNFQYHELQDVTNTFASTSNIENTADKMDMVYAVQFCTSKVLMEAESK